MNKQDFNVKSQSILLSMKGALARWHRLGDEKHGAEAAAYCQKVTSDLDGIETGAIKFTSKDRAKYIQLMKVALTAEHNLLDYCETMAKN